MFIFERDKNGKPFLRTHTFGSHLGIKLRLGGVSGLAVKNTSTNIDYKLPEERYLDGVYLILKNHAFGDHLKFQIVDKDGILAPAGTVLDEFATNYFVDEAIQTQPRASSSYPTKLPKDLYVRLIYTSVNSSLDVDVRMNLKMHKVEPE